MKAHMLDKNGKKTEEVTLKKSLFGVTKSDEMLAQYIRVYRANLRNGNSSTKTRSEVSGSGAKPWSQKGTGRARVGTKRNPIWTHGGVAHGPKPKSWNLQLPGKVTRLALKTALSKKATAETVFLVEKFDLKKPNTKDMATFIKTANAGRKALFITANSDETLVRSVNNLKNVSVTTVDFLNAYDVLQADTVIFVDNAVQALEDKLKEQK